MQQSSQTTHSCRDSDCPRDLMISILDGALAKMPEGKVIDIAGIMETAIKAGYKAGYERAKVEARRSRISRLHRNT